MASNRVRIYRLPTPPESTQWSSPEPRHKRLPSSGQCEPFTLKGLIPLSLRYDLRTSLPPGRLEEDAVLLQTGLLQLCFFLQRPVVAGTGMRNGVKHKSFAGAEVGEGSSFRFRHLTDVQNLQKSSQSSLLPNAINDHIPQQ
ncbi:hypothetical protein NPIL_301501 [Nephila pilipes]|uniref:Uncharacterized protein n=1 Tax=Nephila pilipes TaxID=299642 RepID=A0A8X6PD71_NEPPI|nr:hypothetical protein NPIL_301501 [Nephila pilipes]